MSVRCTARSFAAVAAAYALVLQTTFLAIDFAMAAPAGYAAGALCSHTGDAGPESVPGRDYRSCLAACLACCCSAQTASAGAVVVFAAAEKSLIAAHAAAVAAAPRNPARAYRPRAPPLDKN
jgi:hypothetical protein